MEQVTTPIYLISGFLESGKTTFLKFTLDQDYFRIDGKTLLILCEEGEEEYDTRRLGRDNTVVEVISSKEEFTTQKLETLDMLHQPERVIIEYNGMWLVSDLEDDAAEGLGHRAGDHLRGREHLSGLYEQHEVHFYGHGQKHRHGYFQPLFG